MARGLNVSQKASKSQKAGGSKGKGKAKGDSKAGSLPVDKFGWVSQVPNENLVGIPSSGC